MLKRLSVRSIVLVLIGAAVLIGSIAAGILWLPVLIAVVAVAGTFLLRIARKRLAPSSRSATPEITLDVITRYQPPLPVLTTIETHAAPLPQPAMFATSQPDEDDPMREWRERRMAMFPRATTAPARTGVAATWMPLR